LSTAAAWATDRTFARAAAAWARTSLRCALTTRFVAVTRAACAVASALCACVRAAWALASAAAWLAFAVAAVAAVSLAACATDTHLRNPLVTSAAVTPEGGLQAQPALEVTSSIEISAETGVVAGALLLFGQPENMFGLTGPVFNPANAALLYLIYDPLAPNWTIKERALATDTYHLALRAKSFRTGGDGEAIQIVKRRALQLQREKGYAAYRILDYTEGLESSTPFTHRVSEGTIQLVRSPLPPTLPPR